MSGSPLDGDLRRPQTLDPSEGRRVSPTPTTERGPLAAEVGGGKVRPNARDLGHKSHGQTIQRDIELCGAPETVQTPGLGGVIDPRKGNVAVLTGGTVTLADPPPVPADQVPQGAPTRTRVWGLTLILRAETIISGVDWGKEEQLKLDANGDVVLDADGRPETEWVAADQPPFVGPRDVLTLLYDESEQSWWGVRAGVGFGAS